MFIWDTFIYNPIFNILVWLYGIVGGDIGIAIIALTILIKFALYPLTHKMLKSQKALQEIQPKVKEIQTQYKDQREVQAQKLMELYKKEQVSPMSSCLPLLVQFPFIIAVYQVFREGLISHGLEERLYSFVSNPGVIDPVSFGVNLAEVSVVLAVFAGIAQYFQARMNVHKQAPKAEGKEIPGSKDENMLAIMNKQMLYFMPVLTVVIGMTLPAGLTLYWFISTLFMFVHQIILFKKKETQSEVEVVSMP
jgi:YidC/Oxa1 family membrane protein insertase